MSQSGGREGERLVDPDWCSVCGGTPQVEGTELCAGCLDHEFDDDEDDE